MEFWSFCDSTSSRVENELCYDHRSILEKHILEGKGLNCLTSNFLGFEFDL